LLGAREACPHLARELAVRARAYINFQPGEEWRRCKDSPDETSCGKRPQETRRRTRRRALQNIMIAIKERGRVIGVERKWLEAAERSEDRGGPLPACCRTSACGPASAPSTSAALTEIGSQCRKSKLPKTGARPAARLELRLSGKVHTAPFGIRFRLPVGKVNRAFEGQGRLGKHSPAEPTTFPLHPKKWGGGSRADILQILAVSSPCIGKREGRNLNCVGTKLVIPPEPSRDRAPVSPYRRGSRSSGTLGIRPILQAARRVVAPSAHNQDGAAY